MLKVLGWFMAFDSLLKMRQNGTLMLLWWFSSLQGMKCKIK